MGSDMACRRPHAAIATMLGMGRSEIARFLEFAPTFNGLCGTGKTVRALLAEGAGGCARTADTARPARSRSDLGAISFFVRRVWRQAWISPCSKLLQ